MVYVRRGLTVGSKDKTAHLAKGEKAIIHRCARMMEAGVKLTRRTLVCWPLGVGPLCHCPALLMTSARCAIASSSSIDALKVHEVTL